MRKSLQPFSNNEGDQVFLSFLLLQRKVWCSVGHVLTVFTVDWYLEDFLVGVVLVSFEALDQGHALFLFSRADFMLLPPYIVVLALIELHRLVGYYYSSRTVFKYVRPWKKTVLSFISPKPYQANGLVSSDFYPRSLMVQLQSGTDHSPYLPCQKLMLFCKAFSIFQCQL